MSNTKYVEINDHIITAVTTVFVGVGAVVYAKAHNKDTSIAAIIGTYVGSTIGNIITSKNLRK